MSQERYKNGKIYRLINDVDNEIYVGSTCLPLRQRLCKHKSKSKLEPDRRIYQHLNSIGWDKVKIVLIHNFPCNSKDELLREERRVIEDVNPSLNKCVPTRTIEEWRRDNKDDLSFKNRLWRNNNKEVIRDKKKAYREAHKYDIKARDKAYYEKNKDEINERRKRLYHAKVLYQRLEKCLGPISDPPIPPIIRFID